MSQTLKLIPEQQSHGTAGGGERCLAANNSNVFLLLTTSHWPPRDETMTYSGTPPPDDSQLHQSDPRGNSEGRRV